MLDPEPTQKLGVKAKLARKPKPKPKPRLQPEPNVDQNVEADDVHCRKHRPNPRPKVRPLPWCARRFTLKLRPDVRLKLRRDQVSPEV